MSETVFSLRRKIKGVHELKSVVRTMKAMAAASLGQYEQAAQALELYAGTVERGLVVCLRHLRFVEPGRPEDKKRTLALGVLVFGSDQGMVGQFNEHLAEFVTRRLSAQPGRPTLGVVGERIQARLEDAGFAVEQLYPTPGSLAGTTPLVGQIPQPAQTERRLRALLAATPAAGRAVVSPAEVPLVADKGASRSRRLQRRSSRGAGPRVSLRFAFQSLHGIAGGRKCQPPCRDAERRAQH